MKHQSTMNRIFYSYILVVLCVVLLVGIAVLPLQLQKMNKDLETNIAETATLVATEASVIKGLKQNNIDDTLISRFDTFIENATTIDYIVISNKNSVRLYHPNHDLIGQTFVGSDEKAILSDSAPYITTASGTAGTQKRAFHQITDTDGTVLGFVMVSASLQTIHEVQKNIIVHFFIVLFLVLFIGISFATLLSKSIKKELMGFEPTTFARMYLQRDEILDTLDESIIAIDKTGRQLYRNPAADEFCQEQVDLFSTSLSNQLHTCFKQSVAFDNVLTEIGSDTFLVHLMPLMKQKKKQRYCDGVLIIARNKTELTQMAEQLTGMNHIIDALRANTHEYKNKLHVISGLLQIGEAKQALAFIDENASEIENGQKLVLQQIENKTLAALIIGKINRAQELNIQFVFQKGSHLNAHNDFLSTRELITIIGNLIENAFDAMKDREQLRQVELMIRLEEAGLSVTVDDTGCGMSDQQIESIYAGPYTSKGTGHGYGLRLIQEIVKSHNGFFTIDSEPGEGSSISVVINQKRSKFQ